MHSIESFRIMKKIFTLFLGLVLGIGHAQETFPVNGTANKNHSTYVFANAKIVVDPETTIENGTLIIKDGIITAVGSKIFIPKGAVIYDLKGKTIYPGLIDAYTSYGMPEIKKAVAWGPQMESNIKGAYGWNAAIRSEIEANKIFTDDSKAVEEMRKMGFSAALTFQKDGIVRGSASVVALGDGRENMLIIKDKAAAMYSFDKGSSAQDYPSSLMGAIALLRQTYLDADWYKKDKNKKEYNISLESFSNLQALPQIFETTDKLNVMRADKIGDEFKINYIIKGSGNEYQRIDDIKATNCKLIIPVNFPLPYDVEDAYDANNVSLTELKHWELAPANPLALEKNSIPFAITSSDLKDKKDFWKNIRRAISYGLSEKQALRSLTITPAELLNLSDKLGKIQTGMIANFIITSGNLFDEKTIIHENWIQGVSYKFSDYNAVDVRGNYDFTHGPERVTYQLKIEGEPEKLKSTIQIDTTKTPATVVVSGSSISILFNPKNANGAIRLSGVITKDPLTMNGKGQLPDGSWITWSATYTSSLTETKKDTAKKLSNSFGQVIYPFCAYGEKADDKDGFDKVVNDFKTRYDAVLIKHVTVWTNEPEGVLQNRDVYMTEGKIVRIADDINASSLAFAKVIDGTGKHLTPGIIDEHSHIALISVNEGTQASSGEVRMGDVINSEDINIYRQLSGGVTCSQLLHGSANPIGGQSALIKLRWGKSPEQMKFAGADGFIKFALGENVKQSNWGDANTIRFPQSRMGVEQVYYDYFTRAKEYDAKQKSAASSKTASAFRRDLELEAVAEILNKKRFITCHSYVQSEINMLMHVGDSMGFKVNTFTHILEGYKVADKMKAHGAGASTFSDWWAYKMEVKDAIPYNAALLSKMGVVTAINSDDAEMGRRLNQEAAKTIKYGGLSEEEALKTVTLNPAKLLHIDNKVGSIKVGKDADVVLWSDNPLSVYAKAEKTIIDGLIYYDNEKDIKLREEIQKERARIIQKMVDEKKNGAPTQKPAMKKQKLFECDSMQEDYLMEE
ncbi:MAG: amidohydrolase, imidazolonepropionase [Bacteroidetes bacterium]|nr:amidohydrolase, imidazolonepropionase [Bacteroidota bacterium]